MANGQVIFTETNRRERISWFRFLAILNGFSYMQNSAITFLPVTESQRHVLTLPAMSSDCVLASCRHVKSRSQRRSWSSPCHVSTLFENCPCQTKDSQLISGEKYTLITTEDLHTTGLQRPHPCNLPSGLGPWLAYKECFESCIPSSYRQFYQIDYPARECKWL